MQSESPLVKISPEIQQKVDIFQVEKRKAETSPELTKKEKKKVKNYEKNQRKLEKLEQNKLVI